MTDKKLTYSSRAGTPRHFWMGLSDNGEGIHISKVSSAGNMTVDEATEMIDYVADLIEQIEGE